MAEQHDILNEQYAAACEARRPFITLQPHTRIFIDGNQWCALYGENLQDGTAGFGDSPDAAMRDFDKNWYTKREEPPCAG